MKIRKPQVTITEIERWALEMGIEYAKKVSNLSYVGTERVIEIFEHLLERSKRNE